MNLKPGVASTIGATAKEAARRVTSRWQYMWAGEGEGERVGHEEMDVAAADGPKRLWAGGSGRGVGGAEWDSAKDRGRECSSALP